MYKSFGERVCGDRCEGVCSCIVMIMCVHFSIFIADDAIESSKSKPGDRETAVARMISMIGLVQ